MKIVFMGTPDFAVQSLKALVKAGHSISAVVTVPDKAQGRGLKINASPVKRFAQQNNFPVLQPESLKDDAFISQLDAFKADCFVVVAFRILPRQVFTLPKFGTLNVHASLLPAYRGAAPINWAIIKGEEKTGVTTMFIDAKIDTGDILMQTEVAITPDMSAGELHDILAGQGAGLLIKTLSKIEKSEIQPIVQDETKATKAPKLNNENCSIDFNKPVQEVYNLIRGLSPYPAAFSYLGNNKVKVYKASLNYDLPDGPPATIIDIQPDSFSVACAKGAVKILELQIEGKKRMSARDFLNGYNLQENQVFNIKKTE